MLISNPSLSVPRCVTLSFLHSHSFTFRTGKSIFPSWVVKNNQGKVSRIVDTIINSSKNSRAERITRNSLKMKYFAQLETCLLYDHL